jgi:hypothetical protein
MKAIEIIEEVRSNGGAIQVQGADIVLSATRPLPADLVARVRAHKTEILEAFDNPRTLTTEYRRAGRICIESDWAGTVWLVVSEEHVRGNEDGCVYFPYEIAFMIELSERERRILHGFKRQFGGRIEIQKDAPDVEASKE